MTDQRVPMFFSPVDGVAMQNSIGEQLLTLATMIVIASAEVVKLQDAGKDASDQTYIITTSRSSIDMLMMALKAGGEPAFIAYIEQLIEEIPQQALQLLESGWQSPTG